MPMKKAISIPTRQPVAFHSGKDEINTSSLPKGVYIIVINGKNGKFIHRQRLSNSNCVSSTTHYTLTKCK